jgi:Neuraminidase (sialidase)
MPFLKYILLFLMPICLFTQACKNGDETYTIKGKVLKSCTEPTPIAGRPLVLTYDYSLNKKSGQEYTSTDAEGNFELKYTGQFNLGDLTISVKDDSSNFFRTLIRDIEKNRNLNIGNVLNADIFFAYLRIKTTKPNTQNDTLFFEKQGNKFNKFMLGPFTNGQIIDSISPDRELIYKPRNEHRMSFVYSFKIGFKGKEQFVFGEEFIPCSKQNYLDIEL